MTDGVIALKLAEMLENVVLNAEAGCVKVKKHGSSILFCLGRAGESVKLGNGRDVGEISIHSCVWGLG